MFCMWVSLAGYFFCSLDSFIGCLYCAAWRHSYLTCLLWPKESDRVLYTCFVFEMLHNQMSRGIKMNWLDIHFRIDPASCCRLKMSTSESTSPVLDLTPKGSSPQHVWEQKRARTKWELTAGGVTEHSLFMVIDSGSLETAPCNATPIQDRKMINTNLL